MPSSLVCVARVELACIRMAVTWAPGITAPEGSATVPRIVPVVCAQSPPPAARIKTLRSKNRGSQSYFNLFSPEVEQRAKVFSSLGCRPACYRVTCGESKILSRKNRRRNRGIREFAFQVAERLVRSVVGSPPLTASNSPQRQNRQELYFAAHGERGEYFGLSPRSRCRAHSLWPCIAGYKVV